MHDPSKASLLRVFALALAAFAAGATQGRAQPVISEFMAANSSTLADEDGAYSDWLELHNPDAFALDLTGWFLTDSATNKTKWQVPPLVIPPGGYVIVFASGKNRRMPDRELHTNFALSASGEYLGLIGPDGVTVASEYAPAFPEQAEDVSYGLIPDGGSGGSLAGYLLTPTPGGANSTAGSNALAQTVTFSRPPGPFADAFALELSGADPGERIRYVVAKPTQGGTIPEPTADSPAYEAPIVIEGSAVVRAAVFASDNSARDVASSAYYTKISPTLSSFSSQLPVLVIDVMGSGELAKDGVHHPGWLYVYSPGTDSPVFHSAPELITPLTATVRGSSSAEFPKRGYNIKLADELGNENAQPLLDLPAHEKWALVAPWAFDQGYVNNAFVYSLSNQMGRWAPRTRFAEVFFNAGGDALDHLDYAGVYVLTDRIEQDPGRVDIAKLSAKDVSGDAVTGGYILKIDAPDHDELAWSTTRGTPESGHSSIVLVSPKAHDVVPAQRDYIVDYVQQMEDALHRDAATGWSQRTHLDFIDRASWVDYHLLNTFVLNPDAFERSAYFTKNRGGKLEAGPVWDYDRAMGSNWDNRSIRWNVWHGVGGTDLWNYGWWGVIAHDPEFMQDWIDRWQSLRRAELSNTSLVSLAESLTGEIGEAAAARDAGRWPDNRSPYGSYADQIDHLRFWIVHRAEWIDTQFLAAPDVEAVGATIRFMPPVGAQLAYTLDGSDPRSLGGEIAPNAQLTSSALTVPAGINVQVRSYRADLKGVFPGSPWSSAVGGPESSPLTPRARLVNISTRAMVGAGENALIAGVVVADTMAKRYLARAVGPGLAAFGASGIVPDPQLSIFSGAGIELFRNNGWESGPDVARIPPYSKSVGAFPLGAGSRDSALANAIAAGSYTLQITTPSGQAGIGLAELYELDGNGRTVNLSTRANVGTGDGVLIGGFVVQGPAYKRMLIRAVGPTLGAFGVTNALADPVLTIYRGENIIATNDRWEISESVSAVVAASRQAGAFTLAANSEDAAILITLPPGAFTLEVKGKGDTEGVALLEIYEVP